MPAYGTMIRNDLHFYEPNLCRKQTLRITFLNKSTPVAKFIPISQSVSQSGECKK